jgi:hypothetical protein
MGDGLVGAMVAALRSANRDWAEASRAAQRQPAPREGGASTWGLLAHPSLMPTVFSPSDAAGDDETGESVAARKV